MQLQKISYAFFLTIIICLVNACYSNRYFGTPDYFTKQPGMLILKNGERIKGNISVNNLVGNNVIVYTYQDKKKRTFPIQDVTACELDIGFFAPMRIGRDVPSLYSAPVFMERLTPDSFSLSLFEAYIKLTDPNMMGNVSLRTGVEYDLEYYVHLPYDDPNIVWQLSTPILTTHLGNGLDSLFKQCPELFEKIKSRDPRYDIYFGPQVKVNEKVVIGRLSSQAKAEKVKNIIAVFAEYERCRSN